MANINFMTGAHEKFYFEKLEASHSRDVYHQALFFCLGICQETRENFTRIFDLKNDAVRPECLYECWQTSETEKVVRMAFNLYTNGMPSVHNCGSAKAKVDECQKYTVEDLFYCPYAPYFWQAVQLRYPEYAVYRKTSLEDIWNSLEEEKE